MFSNEIIDPVDWNHLQKYIMLISPYESLKTLITRVFHFNFHGLSKAACREHIQYHPCHVSDKALFMLFILFELFLHPFQQPSCYASVWKKCLCKAIAKLQAKAFDFLIVTNWLGCRFITHFTATLFQWKNRQLSFRAHVIFLDFGIIHTWMAFWSFLKRIQRLLFAAISQEGRWCPSSSIFWLLFHVFILPRGCNQWWTLLAAQMKNAHIQLLIVQRHIKPIASFILFILLPPMYSSISLWIVVTAGTSAK